MTQGSHEIGLDPDSFDPIVAKSPMKVYSCFQVSALIRADSFRIQDGRTKKILPVRVRELVEPEKPRLLEINPDYGESPEGGIHNFMLPQPIMDRMSVDVSTPKESLRIRTGMEVMAQSTPATLPREKQQLGRATLRKPKVTFATPFTEKEAVRSGPNDGAPGSGTRRRTIFEDDLLGTKGAWKRTPEKGPEKHSALIGVRGFPSIPRVGGRPGH